MKYGSIVCTVLFALAVIFSLAQLWFGIFSAELFVKLMLTLGGFFILALGITLVFKDYLSEKEMKKKGFIDG